MGDLVKGFLNVQVDCYDGVSSIGGCCDGLKEVELAATNGSLRQEPILPVIYGIISQEELG